MGKEKPSTYQFNPWERDFDDSDEETIWSAKNTLVDISKSKSITLNTLLKRSFPRFMKRLLDELENFEGLLGADGFVKVKILIDYGRYVDVVVQKIDAYLLGVIKDGQLYEYSKKNHPSRFKSSISLSYSEKHPGLSHLKLGLTPFKQAVGNILDDLPETWQYDLTLITLTLCEGSRFDPFYKILCHIMRSELARPWILREPFPDMFFRWSKFSKIAGDYINNRMSIGKSIEYYKDKVPKVRRIIKYGEDKVAKVRRMTGEDVMALEKAQDVQFSIYILKWPQVRSFDLGTNQKKGQWAYRAPIPEKRPSRLLEAARKSIPFDSLEPEVYVSSRPVNPWVRPANGIRGKKLGKKIIAVRDEALHHEVLDEHTSGGSKKPEKAKVLVQRKQKPDTSGGFKAINPMSGGNPSLPPTIRNPVVPPSFPDGSSPPAVKSRLCSKYNTAEGCRFGDKCHYAHGEWELGKPTVPSHDEDPRSMGPPPGSRFSGAPRMGFNPPQEIAPSGFGASATTKISINAALGGPIIGKNGINSKRICRMTGVKLSLKDHESDPNLKNIELEGTFHQIKIASEMVQQLIVNLPAAARPHQQQKSFGKPGGGFGGRGGNFKTKLCDNFTKGSCTFGDKCHFAHGAKELRKI